MRKFGLFLLTLMVSMVTATAQVAQPERQLVVPELDVFLPHWYLNIQGGVGYDLGEDDFGRLLTPSIQGQVGYQFCKSVGLQLGVSGFWSKGRYAFPEVRYSWKYIQPTLEFRFDLPALFGFYSAERPWNIYALLGGGANIEWGNDDAETANMFAADGSINPNGTYGVIFQKLWRGSRANIVGKAGLGAEYRVGNRLAINLEVNASLLPDHYNNKYGHHNNRDWHFNALVGLHWYLSEPGRRSGAIWEVNEPIIYEAVPEPAEQPDTVLEVHNVFFEINKSIIRTSQLPTLAKVLKFMRENPKAKIQITGYADKDTGTPTINDRLSRERVQAVGLYLIEHGLDENRIRRRARGDRIQPYDLPEDNRVCVCVIYELIDPEPHY